MSTEKKHYRLSPSASDRWLNCPGSLTLSEGMERKSSTYADEGSRAHDMAERVLLGEGFDVKPEDQEMFDYILVYTNFVKKIRDSHKIIEEKVESLQTCADIEGLGGTADYYAIYTDGDDAVLEFVDLKYGVGVNVEAERNTQLLCYAAILESRFPGMIDRFRMSIIQPRAINGDTEKTWECSIQDVVEFKERIRTTIVKDDVVPGEHCRWCPAAVKCDALKSQALIVAQQEFSSLATDARLDDLIRIYRMGPGIKQLLDAIEEHLLGQMRKGITVEGFKAVQSLSHRRWVYSQEETLKKLASRKVGKKIATEVKLKTPAQIEKVAPKKALDGLTNRVPLGIKLVPITAKGEPVDFTVTEFDVIEGTGTVSDE
jgi:hypothetical protein